MVDIDPYVVLGLSPSATPKDIKDAYIRFARRLHPDVNRDNPGAAEQMQDISAAHDLLSDPDRRARYDRELEQYRDRLIFSLNVMASRRTIVPLPEPQVMYLLCEMRPDLRAVQAQQHHVTRLNLTLVLDHSNSMNGARMERVKIAAHQIIDQLNADDILSVVSFNDRAEIVVEATTVTDKPALKARVSMIAARGGTEIYQGLLAGVDENRRYLAPRLVNHIILLTDGHTFGDHERTVKLAQQVMQEGIVISAMGLGQEWNDEFLDAVASATGGTSIYINSSSAVARFLNDHVRSLSNVFAERIQLSIAPDSGVRFESAFKLSPSPQPLVTDVGSIPVGSIPLNRPLSVLLQFELPPDMPLGFRPLARIVASGEILDTRTYRYGALTDFTIEVTDSPEPEEPPPALLDALGKLTLYRMQERAQDALRRGDIPEATQRLERLATRLFEMGEVELADEARVEAQRVRSTSQLSDRGKKTLKYHTRSLLLGPGMDEKQS